MRLETLAPRHLEAALELLRSVEGVTVRGADTPEALARFLERNPELSVAAEAAGSLAGFVFAGHDGRRGYLHHLVVAPAWRRRGFATKLVQEAVERLARAGIGKVHVDVFTSNEEARAFWRTLGWQARDELLRFSKSRDPSA